MEGFAAELQDRSVRERAIVVFLSYHINRKNKRLVESVLAESLESAGARVICGGHISHHSSATKPLGRLVKEEIDKADVLVAIATPDRDDGSPSDYVIHEVGYADGKEKLTAVLVQNDLKIPESWRQTYTLDEFNEGDSGEVVRIVLRRLWGAKDKNGISMCSS